MKPFRIVAACLLWMAAASAAFSQTDTAQKDFTGKQWYLQDPAKDKVAGISLPQAYGLLAGKPARKVVVAILDSGIDTAHVDIAANLWTNPGEIPNDGIDNDGNGYVDDYHGWNFLGNAKGEVIVGETLEKTRIYRELQKKYGRKSADQIPAEEKSAYELYLAAKESYEKEFNENRKLLDTYKKIYQSIEDVHIVLTRHFGDSTYSKADVQGIKSEDQSLARAKQVYLLYDKLGLERKGIKSTLDHFQSVMDTKLNVQHDPRHITGDNPLDILDTLYGNHNLDGTSPGHGTAVTGLVAALRGNGLGIDGIAPQVEIMLVRIVPGGDERDKDVALAIRYAVNQGAQIINCSFGKEFSPQKWMVDEAVKYAEQHGVLIVHASGNDGQDNDQSGNFPTPKLDDGKRATNWVEVGASTKEIGKKLPAGFSNYGKTTVDLFAPGADIMTLDPGNAYGASDGTSVAAPVVTGVAALLLSYYPDLTPAQIREVLMKSVTPYGKKRVIIPGSKKKTRMKNLCLSGGVLNAYQAVKMAEEMAGKKSD